MTAPRRFDARERRALAATFLAAGLASLDTAIANTALPAIASSVRATPADSIWIVNAYQLAVVAVLLPFAALGDRVGPRRVYLSGMALFVLASLGCALARSLPSLAAARALQGVGGGALMSVNIALVRMIYPASRLGRGVGLNALVVGVAFSVGPTVASLLLAVASWPVLFAINLPLGALAFAFGWQALPHAEPRGQRFRPVNAMLTAAAFAALIFALGAGAQRERWWVVAWPLALAAVAGTLLLRRQAGETAPMLPVDLFRRPLFALSALTSTCSFAAQGLAFVALPFYFESVLHRDPVETGFLISPWPLLVALIAPLAGRLSDRHSPAALGGAGLAVLSIGLASLALLPAEPSGSRAIVWRMALCGIGFGFFQSPNLHALMASAPAERSGGASGVIAIARLIGQAVGAALVAWCFGLLGLAGATWALALGAAFAAFASAVSTARLWAR